MKTIFKAMITTISLLGALTCFGGVTYADKPFRITVSTGNVKVGENETVEVRITAKKGHKPNAEYPNKIKKLTASKGAVVGAKSVKGEVKGKLILFTVPVKPTRAGRHTVKGVIRFSVCNDKQCYIKKVPLKTSITGY